MISSILFFNPVLNNKCYNKCFPDKKLYIINYHKPYEFTNPLTYIIKKWSDKSFIFILYFTGYDTHQLKNALHKNKIITGYSKLKYIKI